MLTGLGTNPPTGKKAIFVFAAEYTLLQKLNITIVDQQTAVAALSKIMKSVVAVPDRTALSKISHCNSFDITHNVMDTAARAIPNRSKAHRAIGINRAAELVFGPGVYDIDPAKRGFMLTYLLCHIDPGRDAPAENFLKVYGNMWVGDTLYDKVLNCLTNTNGANNPRGSGLYYTWVRVFPG